MENRKSKFAAFLSSITAGIIVAMIVYFGLNIIGFKEYKANAKLVTTSVENLNEDNPAESFAATLNSKAIKERTLENLKIDWPESKFDNKLSLTPIKSSAIIDISVVDTNKQRAEDLADEYADLSATVINNIYNTGANVMEYSYQNSRAIDNTLNYAAYAGLAGFLIYLIISLVSVNRYNHKLEKSLGIDKRKEKAKAKKQVKKNKKAIEEKENKEEKFSTEKQDLNEIEEELIEEVIKTETRPLSQIEEESDDEFATRKIDSEEIESAMAKENLDYDTNIDQDQEENLVDDEEENNDTNKEEMLSQKTDQNPENIEKSNKLEILGKLPKYQRGALDV